VEAGSQYKAVAAADQDASVYGGGGPAEKASLLRPSGGKPV
jgi:hypothetical protein